MSFWDTIKGNHLADILIKYLPMLCEKKKEQYYIAITDYKKIQSIIMEEIDKGNKYVAMHDDGLSKLLIFEKEI